MCIFTGIVSEYDNITLTPYINIDWSIESKERNVKICIGIGWLFWEFYIDIL